MIINNDFKELIESIEFYRTYDTALFKDLKIGQLFTDFEHTERVFIKFSTTHGITLKGDKEQFEPNEKCFFIYFD